MQRKPKKEMRQKRLRTERDSQAHLNVPKGKGKGYHPGSVWGGVRAQGREGQKKKKRKKKNFHVINVVVLGRPVNRLCVTCVTHGGVRDARE